MAKKTSGTNYVQMYKKYPDVVSMKQVCEMLNIGRNYSHLEYNAKVDSAETIARVLGGKMRKFSEKIFVNFL